MSTEDPRGLPERIGRYRIVRALSKGGMALVYEGRKETFGGVSPRVAIKVILPDYANSSTFRELFINEARLGAAMQHQNLVQILDFDSDGERYFLVMEFVEGLTLSKVIGLAARHEVKLPMHVICEIGRQACEGLHYAHQAVDAKGRALGLIHRDIKPSNLIVNSEGGVKILDFGISKGRLRSERQGSVKGTWGYMAPEQAQGERIGPNVDVFALGIVLYEMAARRSMFKGRKEEEIRQMLAEDYASHAVSGLDPSYAPLADVLRRAMHRDPRKRFATAAELGRHLAELLPDTVSVRQEMGTFYEQLQGLHRQEVHRRGEAEADASNLSSRASRRPHFTLDQSRGDQTRAMLLSMLVGMVVVVLAFVAAYSGIRYIEGGSGLAAVAGGEAQPERRPLPMPPITGGAPEEPQPEPVAETREAAPAAEGEAVAEGEEPAAAEPAPEELQPGFGRIHLGMTGGEGEIYLGGKLMRPPYEAVVEAGTITMAFVAPDGRKVAFVAEVPDQGHAGPFVWDYKRWDWQR
ncbi:MAG: serine/threonine protein kinase [Alphaproteobacteria bacterium]|nr:serine/threonine protein kinase [Alphaproteobacteria bacterium]